jgi:hypothetical protein
VAQANELLIILGISLPNPRFWTSQDGSLLDYPLQSLKDPSDPFLHLNFCPVFQTLQLEFLKSPVSTTFNGKYPGLISTTNQSEVSGDVTMTS